MNLPREIPKTLNECFPILKENCHQKDLEYIGNHPEDTEGFYFSIGMEMRIKWRLWYDSELVKWFNERGIFHADDMCTIILTSFGRWLNDKDILLEEQIKNLSELLEG